MDLRDNRRLWVGLAGVVVAIVVTVLVQSLLLAADYGASAAEAYGIVVGFAVAMPVLESAARPVFGGSRLVRLRLAVSTSVGSLLGGLLVVSTLLSADITGNLAVAGGAVGAYIGGTGVRSYLINNESETELEENQESGERPDSESGTEPE